MSDIRKRVGAKGTTYQVRYPTKSAKSGYAYKTFDTLRDARAFHENLGSHRHRTATEIRTVPQAVRRWLEICEKIGRDGRETVEPATLEEYRRRGRVMQEYSWPKDLQELGPSDVVHFRNWLLENKSRDLARRTLSSFHSVLIEMKHQGHLDDDPAAGISIKSGGRYESDETEVAIPSDGEVRELLAACDRLSTKSEYRKKVWARYRPMIYLATFSGMRPSEYRGLAWSHVFEDHVVVRQRADKTGIIGPVKSKAGKRKIYLPRIVTEMLQEWRDACQPRDDDLVFPTATGRPQLLGKFRKGAWLPLMKEAGLQVVEMSGNQELERPKYTLYALRHYFASKMIEKGADLKLIQETMGHSRVEITINVYGHLLKGREGLMRETAEIIAQDIIQPCCGKSASSIL